MGVQLHELDEVEVQAIRRHARLLSELNCSHPVILDVGANSGAVSKAYLDKLANAIIFAFEPNPELFESLSSRLGDRVTICPVALGDSNENSDLNVFNDDTVSSLFKVDPKLSAISKNFDLQQTVSVQVRTLDSWLLDHPEVQEVNILKIDTQGFDLRVLHGARDLLRSKPPQLIQIEMTVATAYQGQANFPDIWNFLAEFGYHLYDFDRLVHTKNGNLYWGDALFISQSAWDKLELV